MQTFRCGFEIKDYEDILPPYPLSTEEVSKVINIEYDNPEDQYWSKQRYPAILTRDFLFQEATRIKQGVWILIKGMLIWLPPNYYQFLQYGNASGKPPEFRLKRLMNVYEKIRIRKDARYIGTFNIKNRQDGDTTMAMSDALWEVHSGDLDNGSEGIQSKTRNDAINPCWFSLTSQWNGYPKFLKDMVYSHFISGANIAETLKFQKEADPNDPNDLGKNIVIMYGPAVYNAFDGKTNMRRCILDEILKWVECSFPDTFTNYKKFIMPGKERRGLFDMISSPADKNGKHNDDGYAFYLDCRSHNEKTGSSKNRIKSLYSNPLHGIEGFYDKYGDADPEEVFEHIKNERDSCTKDKLMGEVRGYPLPILGTNEPNEEEIFGATDTHNVFINMDGIKEQRRIILGKKRDLVEYGNLEWPQNIPYSGNPVWRKADRDNFDDFDARFCLVDTEMPRIELPDDKIKTPPFVIEEVIGVDPFNLRYSTRNKVTGSQGAALSWKFGDIMNTGRIEMPMLAYLSRPSHQDIMHEDMIKAAIYRRAMIQVENSSDKMENYFEDNGFIDWMLPTKNAKPELIDGTMKIRRGDAPAGRGSTKFINEGIALINGVTQLPRPGSDEFYHLLNFFFEEPLYDLTVFNKDNTQFNHWTMCFIQALLGKVKLLYGVRHKPDFINNQIAAGLY